MTVTRLLLMCTTYVVACDIDIDLLICVMISFCLVDHVRANVRIIDCISRCVAYISSRPPSMRLANRSRDTSVRVRPEEVRRLLRSAYIIIIQAARINSVR